MDILTLCAHIKDILDIPTTTLFFAVSIFLTFKTRFLQIRALPRFISLLKDGMKRTKIENQQGQVHTIDAFHALFTAMATTIGMGNLVGPTVAIFAGGPGALFWLLLYTMLGAVTKFTEVTFALLTRERTADGSIIGGPMQYLKQISNAWSLWYSYIMIVLFVGWSMVQANTLAAIFAQEQIPEWVTGAGLAFLTFIVLIGGAQRVGNIASKLVPIMFVFYIAFAFFILFKDITALKNACWLICNCILKPAAPVGGFLGATICQAISHGVYRGVYITEAGLGTSSIAHAMADTQKPTDQGILAMYSMTADALLSLISGLLVLVTGVWQQGIFRSTLIYEAFKMHAPGIGQLVLIVSISLFVLTTVIGNSFNGRQTAASIFGTRGVQLYMATTIMLIFIGSMLHVVLAWLLMDIVTTLVAVPNLIGISILACRRARDLRI
jgi:AGCS family alanine or glycine:cation symporter